VLLTLAVAAQRGHQGPARNDCRARRLVDALVDSPPFVAKAPPRWKDAQTHAPGFVSSMHTIRSNQHLVVDSEVIDGLRYAWFARRALGLSTAQAAAIVPSSRGAYPYGGIDLARLYSGRQEAAAGIGGRPPASFGLLVREISGRRTFATQLADRGPAAADRGPARRRRGRRHGARLRRPVLGPAGSRHLARRRLDWEDDPPLHRVLRPDDVVAAQDRRPRARERRRPVPELGPEAEVTAVMRDGSERRVGNLRIRSLA
jgi:hypothetical protein